MKKSSFLVVTITSLITAAIHFYLTYEHFQIKYSPLGGSKLCNISSFLNCGNALTSNYATLLGIPISIFAIFLFLFLAYSSFKFYTTDQELTKKSYGSLAFIMNFISVIATVSMAGISFFALGSLCPFCTLTYITSLIIAFYVFKDMKAYFNFKSLISNIKLPLIFLGVFLVGSLTLAGVMRSKFQATNVDDIVALRIQQWKSKSPEQVSLISPISEGPEDAPLKIVEFADYLCGHCKSAYDKIHLFLKSHPDVRLDFMHFPLDGCKGTEKNPGLRCQIAMISHCSQKLGQGAAAQSFLFGRQMENMKSSAEDIITALAESTPLDHEQIVSCYKTPETLQIVKSQYELGMQLKIDSTPSFFINGKSFRGAGNIPTLEALYRSVKN